MAKINSKIKAKEQFEKIKQSIWFLERTPQERRDNYLQLRVMGLSSFNARRVRDWRPKMIRQVLEGERSY